MLKSKFFLIDVCFEKAVDCLNGQDILLTKVFAMIRQLVCTTFVALSKQLEQAVLCEI